MKLRRVLSLLVALVMTVEVLPLSSIATEIEDATENVEVSAEGILEETETMEILYGEVTEEESEPILGATAEEAESSGEADIATVSEEETDNGDVAIVSESTESNAIISHSGTCGDNLTWALYSDGLLVILGTGEMTDYVDSPTAFDTRAPWFSYRSSIESVIVDSGVTSIGNYAFRSCANMTSIVLPDTIESIGEYAFRYCESLTEISIPACTIGTYAFDGSTNLSSITFRGEVTSIGYRAFINTAYYDDENNWDNGVLYIGNWLIATDGSFETCSILDGTVGIADRAFYENTGLTTVVMPSSLKYIGTSAFYGCTALPKVSLGISVEVIGSSAFSGCTALSEVAFGNNIKTIGSYAFYKCSSLKNLSLSTESVTSIGTYAFYGTGYYKDSNNWTGDLLYVDTWLVNIKGLYLISSTDVVIKDGTTGIADYTFREQSTLTSISIPDGVKYIGEGAFYKCSSITGISIPDSVVTEIEDYLFYQCSSLEYVDGYSSATSIGACAFYWDKSLTGFSIPASVTSIGGSAFYQCTSLDGVDLSNVTSIGNNAFNACESLKSVQIICDVGESTFQYCTSLEDVTFGDSVTSIGKSAFNGCSSLTTVVLPESVVSIDQYAFTDCYLDAVWILAIAMEGIGYVTSTSKVFDETDEFVIYGYSGSFAESYADAHSITFIAIDYFTKTLSVTVCDPDGAVLTDGYTVAWYDSDGNVVGTDSVLRINSYDTCTVVVTLDDELASLYEQPDEYTFSSSESEEYTITLEEIPTMLLTGAVTDGNGMPLSGATISVLTQGGNTYTVLTDEAGTFNVYVSKEEISVKIQMNGYYSHTAYIDLSDFAQSVYDFGTYALTGVISDGIILSITKYDAAVDVSDRIATTVIYADTLDISLTDSYGNAITGFEVQGTNIVFEPGVVSPGETICVSVADPTGKYVSTGSVTTTLDGNSRGEVSISLIQKGGFRTGNLTGEDATVTVLDSNENVVLSSSTSSNTTYCELDSGKYTVILIEKTSLLRTALSEDYLSQLGLTEGVDYLAFDISVEDGVIIVLDDCNIPEIDDDKLSYVVADKTSLTVSKSSGITIGEMFTICAKYEIDSSKNVQSDSVSIVFPEGINPSTLNSVLVDNVVSSYSYNSKTRTLTVDTLGKDSASIYLMGQAGSESGNYYLCAYLNMSDGAMQSIGSAKVTVELSSFDVAERTSSSTVIASGITAPYSELTIYDNGVAVTTTTSNAVGKWSTEVPLSGKLYSYSYHYLSAEITSDNFVGVATTEEKLVIYDERAVEVQEIVMYNYGHSQFVTVFDFTDMSTVVPYYDYNANYPTFTFTVKMSENATEWIEDLYVCTVDPYGDKTYVELTYDDESGLWVGSHDYEWEEIPTKVGVAYNCSDEYYLIPDDTEMIQDFADSLAEWHSDIVDYLTETIEENCVFEFNEDEQIGYAYYANPDTGEQETLFSYESWSSEVTDDITSDDLETLGYSSYDSNEMTIWYYLEVIDNVFIVHLVDLQTCTVTITTIDYSYPVSASEVMTIADENEFVLQAVSAKQTSNADLKVFSSDFYVGSTSKSLINVVEVSTNAFTALSIMFSLAGDALLVAGLVASPETLGASALAGTILNSFVFKGIAYAFGEVGNSLSLRSIQAKYSILIKKIAAMRSTLTAVLEELQSLLYTECGDGSYILSGDMIKIFIDGSITPLRREIKNLGGTISSPDSAEVGSFLNTLGSAPTGIPFVGSYTSMVNLQLGSSAERYYSDKSEEVLKAYNNILNKLSQTRALIEETISSSSSNCEEEPKKQTPRHKSVFKAVEGGLDPSGYVYEAVPSNTLEGVTAVISYNDNGNATEWDAEAYSQANPQVTDESGTFQWDVPAGEWIVSFTKDGYYSTDTSDSANANDDGWLPVPPPQVNIAVAMVSTASPTVESVITYTDRIEIVFSQYMDMSDSDTASVLNSISVTRDGTVVDVIVTALDAEYDLEGTTQYATRFAVVPSDGVITDGMVVTVDGSAENYASTPIGADYVSDALIVQARPTEISSDDSVEAVMHETTSIEVALMPAISGTTLTVESSSEDIVSVTTASITTDANGIATLQIEGRLPGAGVITVTEPISGVSTTIDVSVVWEASNVEVEPVVATLEDGTVLTSGMTIPAGSVVTLSTTTSGATIRYTVNDTCPKKDAALYYSEPIVIDEDTVLRAAAYLDGTYSSTIRFELTVDDGSCSHVSGEAVKENIVNATCTTDGSYDSVVYCTVCGEELSRETIVVPAAHTAGTAVRENVVEATRTTEGSYDLVTYCTVCGEEISRETVTVPATGVDMITVWLRTPADYSAVNNAIAKANALNSDDYTNFSDVTDAINAVNWTYNALMQSYVNEMAEKIETAIANLIPVGMTTEEVEIREPIEDTNTDTEDDDEESSEPSEAETNPTTGIAISILPMMISALVAASSKRR